MAVLLVAFEAVSVKGGGGFWLHYLVGLVPGLALALALSLARLRPGAAWWRWAPRVVVVGGVVAATVGAAVPFVQDPPELSHSEATVASYLRDHAHLGRTAVVAFGRATILQAADMQSPYPQLWTIPVLTDDPDLEQLAPVLAEQRATWVVTRDAKLRDWGLADTRAMRTLLRENYVPALQAGNAPACGAPGPPAMRRAWPAPGRSPWGRPRPRVRGDAAAARTPTPPGSPPGAPGRRHWHGRARG